jgi:hypothetical protein
LELAQLQQGFMTDGMGFRVKLRGSNPEPLMSALGQRQTSRHLQPMSALPPKADIGIQSRDVRFVPKADILRCSRKLAIRSTGRLFIPPALRERNARLREFVSYGEDSMFHCGAIAL